MTDHPAEGTPLLPCPFCGKLDAFAERFDLSSCYIQCNDCGAQGPTCCQDGDDEEMPGEDAARRAWNTRHSQGASATTPSPAESMPWTAEMQRAAEKAAFYNPRNFEGIYRAICAALPREESGAA